jgi:hypothetical protein
VPGETTTTVTVAPPNTVTPPTEAPASETPPPPVDPPGGAETTPPVEAEVIDPGDQTVDLGELTPPEREVLESELDQQGPLAATGSQTLELALMGAAAIGFGVGLTKLAAWRRRSA